MFEKLLKQWAKEQGFDVWSQDHAAVLNNLAKWLDKNSTQKSAQRTDLESVLFDGFEVVEIGDAKYRIVPIRR